MSTAPPRRRCWARRSARTSTARSSAGASARRSSPATRTSATRTRSWGRPSTALARALLARGLEPGDRLGIWSPNCAEWVLVQYATAKAGIVLVNINPAYRTSELEYALRQSGCRCADRRAGVQDLRLRRDGRVRCAATLPELEHVVFLDAATGTALAAGTGPRHVELPDVPVRRRDQHPVHERHHGLPQGRHAQPPQHPQQRLLRGRGLPLHRGRPRLHPGALLPLLRHGHGQPRLHHARRLHGDPGGRVRAGGDAARPSQEERCTSLYGVPTMFIAELEHPHFAEFDLSSLRTGIMAGSPCPIETMRRVVDEMHMEEVTICYGMTETSPVSTQTGADDPLEKRVGTVGRVHPHVEIKVVDPETGRDRRPRRARRAVHPRLLGDARLLGRAGEDRRGDRPRPLDAHRRPRGDGRRGLPEHRRADQGHGHPRRRERLPARDRGVPLRPSGRRRRAGHRRARRSATARS